MSEYIIDMGNSSYQSTSGLLCADVSQLREEIVRCYDCKFCHSMATKNGIVIFCTHFDDHRVVLDGFCSWGVRRDV